MLPDEGATCIQSGLTGQKSGVIYLQLKLGLLVVKVKKGCKAAVTVFGIAELWFLVWKYT